MRKDKEDAFKMRKEGKSYKEICNALRIPKSTLSGWMTNLEWSSEIKEKLRQSAQTGHTIRLRELNKLRGEHLKKAYDMAREEARTEFEVLKVQSSLHCRCHAVLGRRG